LKESIDKKVGAYSRGMRQRLGIADVLMKNPHIVILDEPTLGIDPEGIRELLDLITELSKKDGLTVLISSHHLHQIQQICDRVGIFVGGKLIASGPIETLGEQVLNDQSKVLEFNALPYDEKLTELVNSLKEIDEVKADKGIFTIISKVDVRKKLVHLLVDNDYTLMYLRLRGGDLDDIYRSYFAKEEMA
jgi:ABC-2 type transport system ATP-binding protein